jgi:iron(III) transport system substrate-binding protein
MKSHQDKRKGDGVKHLLNTRRTLAAVSAILIAAAAAGTAASAPDSSGAKNVLAGLLAGKPKAATAKEWATIVANAKKEGSVTLYTSQNPALLAQTAKDFQEKYGISVTINRQIDGTLTTQVNAEYTSGNVKDDVLVIASKPLVLGAQKPENAWAVNAVGPALYAKGYDRAKFGGPGKANVVGLAILGITTNTSLYSKTIKDLPDVIDPALNGRIGIVSPSAPSLVDWYLWVQQTYGKSLLTKLAAMNPKVYVSSLPMQQAVISGEISVGTFTPTSALDDKAKGAPINYVIPKGPKDWNAPWWGMVLKKAPHPNAAQLLINYLVTKEGQQSSQRHLGAVIKNVPDTFYVEPRKQNLLALTPQKVTEFQNYWNGLFKK